MSEVQASSATSRRNIFRATALASLAGGIAYAGSRTAQSHAVENNSIFPDNFSYPDLTGPSLALWGSSSFEGARATEGVPAGFDARVSTLLSQYLGLPVLNFGRGGEYSVNIAARRGVSEHTYIPVLPQDILPESGSLTLSLQTDRPVTWNQAVYAPGFIQDIPVVLEAGAEKDTWVLTRMTQGASRYAPAGTGANAMQSYQEMISRASYHVLQIGRNNLAETDRVKTDTQLCFDKAPERSLVIGHFPYGNQNSDHTTFKAALAYNEWASATYGNRFIDTMGWMRDVSQQSWLRYGDLAGSGIWNSKEDQKDYEEGKVPRTLYASDKIHLNGWGYMVMARAIEAKVRELGWVA